MAKAVEVDYEHLRQILEHELCRPVTTDEATATGGMLMNIYEVLLYDGNECDKVHLDTTNQTE